MANVLIDGAIIRVTMPTIPVDQPYFSTAATKVLYLDVPITGTGAKITKGGKKVCIITDITAALAAITGEVYHTTLFGLGAGGADGQLGWTVNSGAVGATKMTDTSIKVALDTDSGTISLSATPPIGVLATNAVPNPDLAPIKLCTWAVQDHGQGTVLLTAI